MSAPRSAEFESLVGEAVRGFIETRRRSSVDAPPVRLPLAVRSDDDLLELVRWFKLLCASDALRERFMRGAIVLDPKLMPTTASAPGEAASPASSATARDATAPLSVDEAVVTEAVLRRSRADNQVVILRCRAVITPAARDYARTAGIRMERSSI